MEKKRRRTGICTAGRSSLVRGACFFQALFFFFLAPIAQVGRSGDRHRELEICWVLTFHQLLPDNVAPLPPGVWQGHLGDSGDFGDISYSLVHSSLARM